MAEMLGSCPVISRSSPEKPLYGTKNRNLQEDVVSEGEADPSGGELAVSVFRALSGVWTLVTAEGSSLCVVGCAQGPRLVEATIAPVSARPECQKNDRHTPLIPLWKLVRRSFPRYRRLMFCYDPLAEGGP